MNDTLSKLLRINWSKSKLLRLGKDLAHVYVAYPACIVMLVLFPWLKISLKELQRVLIPSHAVVFLNLH